MAFQVKFKISDELSKAFADATKNGDTRIIKVSIVNESLVESGIIPVKGSFKEDYAGVEELLDGDNKGNSAYVLVRLDEKNDQNANMFKWLFLIYVPDNAKARDKMLSASAVEHLKKELGDYHFVDKIYATKLSELNWSGYQRHLSHKSCEAPLTHRERELAEAKEAEAQEAMQRGYNGVSTRNKYVTGIEMPLADEAKSALAELSKPKDERQYNFVTLGMEKEQVILDEVDTVGIKDIGKRISSNHPRYTFFVYPYESKEAIVFFYTCPSSSKIRDRMLYAASKGIVVNNAKKEGLEVVKKFETTDPTDITEEYIRDGLLSSQQPNEGSIVTDRIGMLGQTKGGFQRPMAPNRRKPAAVDSQPNPAPQEAIIQQEPIAQQE